MNQYGDKARFFDRAAPDWAHGRFDSIGLAIAARILRQAAVRAGMTILEPGCGAGRMTRVLADAVGANGKVIATDISKRMVAAARSNVSAPQVSIHNCAVEELPLASESVDLVLCFDVFPHFEAASSLLRQLKPALKRGGAIVVAHYPGRSAVNALHAEAGDVVGADRLPPAREMRSLFGEAGFKVSRLQDEDQLYYLEAHPA